MHEMFTYANMRRSLIGKSYLWEDNFELIERVITASEVLIAYPKSLYDDTVTEKSIFFFSNNSIYNLVFESGKSYRVVTFITKNIMKIITDIQGRENATLIVKFPDEDIVLSSSDSINRYQDYKYFEVILEIAKLYSN